MKLPFGIRVVRTTAPHSGVIHVHLSVDKREVQKLVRELERQTLLAVSRRP